MSQLSTISELQDLSLGLEPFEQQISQFADLLELKLTDFHCDHVSVRCHQLATAERWRRGFMQCATLLSEKDINGRPICLFDLQQPLQIAGMMIDCVELPYPGNKVYRTEGWEHIELVIACAPEALHQQALAILSDRGLLQRGVKLKFSSPEGRGEQLVNPTLAVTDGNITIKFHPYSIREVVASER